MIAKKIIEDFLVKVVGGALSLIVLGLNKDSIKLQKNLIYLKDKL